MKIAEKFIAGKTLFAFELLPPLKGDSIETLFGTIEQLRAYDPAYVNITYHQQQTKLFEMAGGLFERRSIRKRPGTVAIAAAIAARFGLEVVPHLICGGFNKYDTEDALIDLSFLGIDNVLALRGDAQGETRSFEPQNNGHSHACDLVKQIIQLNGGQYLDSQMQSAKATNFCVGVAGYPEKHSEAPNMLVDIEFLKAKVDAGAEYVVTQMFYDNGKYFKFVERCRAAGIEAPIVAGLKPFSTVKQLSLLPQTFGIDIPEALSREVMQHAADPAAVRQIGVEWAVTQGRELMAAGVPALHFYTMGKADNVATIAKTLF